jgi:hypothetical protein
MDNLTKILQILNNGLNNLSRKFDNLAIELRNRKQPNSNINVDIGDNVVKGVSNALAEGLKKLEIPTPNIILPEQKAPIVNVPAPIVNFEAQKIPAPIINVKAPIVNIPPANIIVESAPVIFPDTMKVEGMDELLKSVSRETDERNIFDEVSSKKPLPIIVMGKNGKQITEFGGDFTAPSMVAIRVGTTAIGEDNPMPVTVDGFAIPMFDTQVVNETDPNNVTITYRRNGTTVAVKTIITSGAITTISVA